MPKKASGLSAFVASSQEKRVHRHCLICDQPKAVVADLDTLIKLKADGKLPKMTLPMVVGYLNTEHAYDVTWQALRNHVTLCRGVKWIN